MSDNLEEKINELKDKSKKDKKELKNKNKKDKEDKKKHLELTNKEIDFFKKNLIQYEKKLKDLIKLLNKDKDNVWKLTFAYYRATFSVNFETDNFPNDPHIYLNIYVVIDRNQTKKDKYIKVSTSEQWTLDTPYFPEKFSAKGFDPNLEDTWQSLSSIDFRGKYKRFNLDEPKNAFDYFVDQIINITKINYEEDFNKSYRDRD